MKRFEIALKTTKRGCQMKVSSCYRSYLRYFQTVEGALAYAKALAESFKNTHKRCEVVSLFINGVYQENLLDTIQ